MMELLTEQDLSILYDHKTPAQLARYRQLSEILLRNITRDCASLCTTHYQTVREELKMRCMARINYINKLMQQHAEPPIPLPKPTQPASIFFNQ